MSTNYLGYLPFIGIALVVALAIYLQKRDRNQDRRPRYMPRASGRVMPGVASAMPAAQYMQSAQPPMIVVGQMANGGKVSAVFCPYCQQTHYHSVNQVDFLGKGSAVESFCHRGRYVILPYYQPTI